MKTVTVFVLFFLAFLAVNAAPEQEVVGDYSALFMQIAGQLKEQVPEFKTLEIDYANLTDVLIKFGGGVLSGLFTMNHNTDGMRCFDGIKEVTDAINYIIYIVQHGLEKDTIKMVRQLLVAGIMVLTAVINEWTYCRGLTTVLFAFYYTPVCAVACRRYYYPLLAGRVVKNTYEYFYYVKESCREFMNKNYQLSGTWLGYALHNVVLVYSSCLPCYNE